MVSIKTIFSLAMLIGICFVSSAVFAGSAELQESTKDVVERILAGKDLQQALEDIEKSITDNPDSDKRSLSNAYFVKADIYRRLGNTQKAKETFQFIADKYPSSEAGQASANKCSSPGTSKKTSPAGLPGKQSTGKNDDIAAKCRKVMQHAAKPSMIADEVLKCMQSLYNKGNYKDCKSVFDGYFSKFGMAKESVKIVTLMVDCYYASGEYAKGIDLSKQLLARFPKEQNVTHNLVVRGNLLNESGNYPEARKWYLKAIKLDKSNAQAYMSLGLLSQREGKYEEAHSHYEKAKKLAKQQHDNFLLSNAEAYLNDVAPALSHSDDTKTNSESVMSKTAKIVFAVVVLLIIAFRLVSIRKAHLGT
ncbi:MAG: tetratricopeptide repeat protein [Armatimonadota bacterium]|nr:tetratricopeptide repeat protein [bacterium]